ncbi:hypothetical protein VP1G_10548 [Cytospora mali]|uniref:Uncharacterized protein n=1 Tax=Cytospora mali TaxID=578113 RepID=A0A194UMK0_CYTMA|nr:hypothetical protein VP1G_10548 [Valsa mali var. pyri (nom. inval.)]
MDLRSKIVVEGRQQGQESGQSITMSRWLEETEKEEPWKGVAAVGSYQGSLKSQGSNVPGKDIDNWSMKPEHGSIKDGEDNLSTSVR